jgi:hypothetical protein
MRNFPYAYLINAFSRQVYFVFCNGRCGWDGCPWAGSQAAAAACTETGGETRKAWWG